MTQASLRSNHRRHRKKKKEMDFPAYTLGRHERPAYSGLFLMRIC